MLECKGVVFKFGDNINTDYIISSRRKKDTLDTSVLKQYIMEDIRPGFYHELKGVSFLVAGENFGCGSAMEVSAQVVKENNIPVILAKSFARSYYRNAINNGILIVEMDTDSINENDTVNVKMDGNFILVEDLTNGYNVRIPGFRDEIREIIICGGLVGYMRKKQNLRGDRDGEEDQ